MGVPMNASRSTSALTLLMLATAASACATARTDSPFRAGGEQDENVLLTVDNGDFRDATIYAYWNGMKDRVGMVVGKTSETFRMRWRSEAIRLEVDFVGGGGYRTDIVDVWAGDHLNFQILPGS